MTKRIIAFICVLTLVVSMCSVFSFAAEPDVKVPQEGTRTGGVHFVVKTATYLYVSKNINGAHAYPSLLPVGTNLVRVDNGSTIDDGWYKMMYGSYVGYIPKSRLTEVQ